MIHMALVLLTLSIPDSQAPIQTAIFIVRHAERADRAAASPRTTMMSNDSDLSREGRRRAESLASMLRDAGIAAIYTSETKRARQTAAPLARALKLDVVTVPAVEVTALVEKVRAAPGNALIVGHSNTIPKILAALGVTSPIEIGEGEYDNLFLVIPDAAAPLVRLRYR